MTRTPSRQGCPIIALDKFIQATRDSGYKGTSSAVSELIDNSIQAEATEIHVSIEVDEDAGSLPMVIRVLDNGCGMDPFTLRQALRFGGSTRFGDRSGLGRYGMGLPNSSLSQARRVQVYTWQTLSKASRRRRKESPHPPAIYSSYLDVDEIAADNMRHVPAPHVVKSPPPSCRGRSGTLVEWTRCDRLDNRRVQTISRKLHREIGRRFRHFLWSGVKLTINGEAVKPLDPLFLHREALYTGATLFGEVLEYEVQVDPSDPGQGTGMVRVSFSILPVHEWHALDNAEKRARGISKGAGVSMVRAGREVDYGWFFMGGKRRENYDDWWRCEVHFDASLDEAFGITHTKQQTRPRQYLLDALTPDLETQARVLNNLVRKAHLSSKSRERSSRAEKQATERGKRLSPLPSRPTRAAKQMMATLKRKHPELHGEEPADGGLSYSIVESSLRDTLFFTYAHDKDRLVLVLNPEHPFYKKLYRPLADSDTPRDRELRTHLELLLLAAVRSEASRRGSRRAELLATHRREWSDTLATFLSD